MFPQQGVTDLPSRQINDFLPFWPPLIFECLCPLWLLLYHLSTSVDPPSNPLIITYLLANPSGSSNPTYSKALGSLFRQIYRLELLSSAEKLSKISQRTFYPYSNLRHGTAAAKGVNLLLGVLQSCPHPTSQNPMSLQEPRWSIKIWYMGWELIRTRYHNSPIFDECQTQSAKVLTLPWKRANQDHSNDTPQPICESQVDFPLLWIKAHPGLS